MKNKEKIKYKYESNIMRNANLSFCVWTNFILGITIKKDKINKPIVAIRPVKSKNSGKKLEANKVNELNKIITALVLFLVL